MDCYLLATVKSGALLKRFSISEYLVQVGQSRNLRLLIILSGESSQLLLLWSIISYLIKQSY